MATPKEIRRRGRWSLILGTIFAFAALAAVAYADDISNNLDASADASAEVMALNVGGPNGTTRLYVVPQGGDGKPGCNFGGTTGTLQISLASSNTSAATVSPSAITVSNCVSSATGPLVTVTPHDAGAATISATLVSNGTGASFDLAPFTFIVNVAPPPNTAPSIEVAGVTGGASYDKGSVPAATCEVTDAEDGDSSFAATLSSIIGPHATDGIGQQTASCSYTDEGGLNVQDSLTYNIVDPSPPTIGYTLDPASPDGSNGWYTSDVSLTWDVSETQSPNSLSKTGCVDQSVTADQAATTYSCSASSAGGPATQVDVAIKRDATAPTVSGAPTASANDEGWYNRDVSITWTCSDDTSGLAAGCPADSTISAEGQGLTANSGDVKDSAGNVTNVTSSGVNIDKTAPNAPTVDLSPVANPQGWNNAAVTVTFVWAGDGGAAAVQSGEGSCTAPSIVSSESLTVAGTTVSGTCTDKAGNTSAATEAVVKLDLTEPTIDADAGAYVSGSWTNQTVTVKFDCFDALSGLLGTCPADVIISSNTSTDGQNVSRTVSDNAGNTETSDTINVKVDKTAPTISGSRSPLANAAGWNNTDVVVSFTCGDALSGLASCGPTPVTVSANGAGQSVGGAAVDNAGNSSTATVGGISIDKTAPTVELVGGPANGGEYYFGSVPAAPTCSASDSLSGLDGSCSVSGYGTSVGSHTVSASAKDVAGNAGSSASRTYTVLAWTLNGFFQPVDMNGVFNTVKSGSTVPLKFRVFSGSSELTDIAAVKSMTATKVVCGSGVAEDAIEELAPTGGTVLRYDPTGAQFIYNWKTSGRAGDCYRVTMTTQDLSTIVAFFKLK